MTALTQNRNGTTPVQDRHRFDELKLAQWMERYVDGFAGPLTVNQFKGGQSNPTYQLHTPDRDYVLRRKPPGTVLKNAHAVDREARVMQAVKKAGLPVAHVFGMCTDDDVIGSKFFVMEMVEGRIIWDTTFPDVSREERPAYFAAMNETIARLHQIDFEGFGLGDFGRSGGYFQRQLKTWGGQYLEDDLAGRDPFMDKAFDWLLENIPAEEETSIVHGDFRCDNMIFHPVQPKVLAILDWELSTLGHPVADFAYHCMIYRMDPELSTGLVGSDLPALNIPSEEEYKMSYCRHTGRLELAAFDYAVAFNFFRYAAILHGIKGRVLRGTASHAHAKSRAEIFPRLAKLAWEQCQRAGA